MVLFQKGLKNILKKHPDDVVFLSALRTPITNATKGGLCNAYPEQMLAAVLHATLIQNPNVPPSAIQDVAVGTVLSELGGSKAARMALNHVGYPSSTSLYTVNRACASSLQAITSIADSISVGRINVGIGAGMESMTMGYSTKAIPVQLWPELKKSHVKEARDCIMPMAGTSEVVARKYEISRRDQDAFSVESHGRASKAQKSGLFDREIVPVVVSNLPVTNPPVTDEPVQSPDPPPATISQDDGIRHDTSLEKMARLEPFHLKVGGSTTAGNTCKVSDGAAAALMMRRSTAASLGLSSSIIGKFAGAAVVGVAPDEMGVGPAYAIPALLSSLEVNKEDVNVWEINEAFASQALYCIRKLGLEKAMLEGRINPRGGAIALGHPLGATGARMVSTLLHEMGRGELGVVSMCVGTGMGMAALFVTEHPKSQSDSLSWSTTREKPKSGKAGLDVKGSKP